MRLTIKKVVTKGIAENVSAEKDAVTELVLAQGGTQSSSHCSEGIIEGQGVARTNKYPTHIVLLMLTLEVLGEKMDG